MNPGLVILLLAVVVAAGFGLHRRRVDGRFAAVRSVGPVVGEVAQPAPVAEEVAQPAPVVGEVAHPAPVVEEVAQRPSRDPGPAWSAVAASLPGAELGERATLVQFSSAFCAPCRTTRVVLADVAERYDGVAHVEIDAEEHLALVRQLDVRRTPTTLMLDHVGNEITRAAGAPRREQVLAALPSTRSPG
ncbi:MAG TPA: thioredoxin family protein [Nocardioides sp.]|nr:thioredoxin family protein [Nocardioides sp.]